MGNKRMMSIIILMPFTALTIWAVAQVGLIGIFEHLFQSPAGWQVFIDLVIALVLVLSWLIPEAQKAGRNPWPYVIATLLAGSFGPLLYLVFGVTSSRE